ncbi:MAG: BMP family ABC transporter substrate-binding protein [Bacillota bacterium]
MKKAKFSIALLALLMSIMMLFVACAPAPAEETTEPTAAPEQTAAPEPTAVPEDKISVFMAVGTGGLGDGGYNDSANAGAVKAQEEFGIDLQVYEPKSLSEIEAQFLAAGESKEYDLLIGIGMDNASGVDKASTAYPDQSFAIFQAVYDKPNVLSANIAIEDGGYLIGVLVATLYKENALPNVPAGTHKMGMVLAMAGEETSKEIFAIQAGGKSVDPDFEVITTEIGSWTDHAKAKELAVSLFEKGCGVVTHYAGSAGNGIFEAAKETGGYVIGAHSNQNEMADTVICSTVEDMTSAVYNLIKSYVDGSFAAGSIRYGLKDNVDYVTFDNSKVAIPDSVKQAVDAVGQKIISGEIEPPVTQAELDAFVAGL